MKSINKQMNTLRQNIIIADTSEKRSTSVFGTTIITTTLWGC